MSCSKTSKMFNVNVGVLGHVDCGKTSLVAALSTTLSTAALDKHPQSKERGITLDLGFSSFTVPHSVNVGGIQYDAVQFTLVDCPGHASLIKTIIGGAQIIDVMLLVIDITKGIQAQTAECLVVGELSANAMLVVLNKVDLLPEAQRVKLIAKAKKRIRSTLEYTKFAGCPMVAVAAAPGSRSTTPATPEQSAAASNGQPDHEPHSEAQQHSAGNIKGQLITTGAEGLAALVDQLLAVAPLQARDAQGPFLFAADHCFAIRGQGTVMTGTVLQGQVKVSDMVQVPSVNIQRKVKSMQMFRKSVQQAVQGDRVGICLTQVDPSNLERCLLCTPGTVATLDAAILQVEKVRFYAGQICSGSKIHITVGHAAALATVTFFGLPDGQTAAQDTQFDTAREYLHQHELYGLQGRPWGNNLATPSASQPHGSHAADPPGEAQSPSYHIGPQWAYAVFATPVTAPMGSLCIGVRLDDLGTGHSCRIAFSGRIVSSIDPNADAASLHNQLRVYKLKQKEGIVDRIMPDKRTAICRDLLKKDSDVSLFVGLKVQSSSGVQGVVQGGFGKSGKVKVMFNSPAGMQPNEVIRLTWKKFVYDKGKRQIAQ